MPDIAAMRRQGEAKLSRRKCAWLRDATRARLRAGVRAWHCALASAANATEKSYFMVLGTLFAELSMRNNPQPARQQTVGLGR